MNCINTLRDLRDHINNTNGTKLPTAKALREGEAEVVALSSVGANAKLTVYQSGYFLYQVDGKSAVLIVLQIVMIFGFVAILEFTARGKMNRGH